MKTNRHILRKHSATLAMIVVFAVALQLVACAKEPMQEPAGIITMTTRASEVSFLVAGAEDFVIDWGNGKKSNVNDASRSRWEEYIEYGDVFVFEHVYSETTAHKIVITGNVAILRCVGKSLTALDVSRCPALIELWCQNNELTSLDVTRNPALKKIFCQHNPLTALDVSKNTALEELEVGGRGNQLTILDVSNNTALIHLHIAFTQITRLDVSKNNALWNLVCRENQLSADELNYLFRTLTIESVPPSPYIKSINIRNNPGTQDCNRSIAEEKGWTVRQDRFISW